MQDQGPDPTASASTSIDDPGWHRDEPDSPCQRICVIHPDHGICLGCHRTACEISDWAAMTPEARQTILATLPARGTVLRTRRGGRAGRGRGGSE